MPAVGDAAPEFSMQDTAGNDVTLGSLKGKHVVLYFYPKDDTPGCTIEGKEFSELLPAFAKKNAVVYGVSRDDNASHKKFTEKCSLTVPLLTDDSDVCERYGVYGEKSMYGKTFMGITRATFLLDPEGRIAHVWAKVSPKGHATAVLGALNSQ